MSYGAHLAGRAPVHDAAIAALERLLQSQEDDDSPSAECNSDPNLPCCDIFARLEEPCGEYLPGYFGGDDDTSGGDDEQGDDDDDDFDYSEFCSSSCRSALNDAQATVDIEDATKGACPSVLFLAVQADL